MTENIQIILYFCNGKWFKLYVNHYNERNNVSENSRKE